MTDFALARRNMVEGQLRPNRVTSVPLLEAIGDMPREQFLADALRSVAYADDDVPVGGGRFLMEPMVLARMIQALQPNDGQGALVVASGCGYGAALLGRLVKSVVALESDVGLAQAADRTIKSLGLANVRQMAGKAEDGAAGAGPFDLILVEGAVRLIPQALLDQLAENGRLAAVVAGPPGTLGVATLVLKEDGVTSSRPLFEAGTPALPGFAPAPRFTF